MPNAEILRYIEYIAQDGEYGIWVYCLLYHANAGFLRMPLYY